MTFNGNKTVKRGIFPLDFNVQSYWSSRWVFWSDKGLANVILTGTWPYLSCEEKGNFLPFPKGNSGQTRGFNCKVFFLELDRKTYNKIHPHNAQTHSEKSTHPRVNKNCKHIALNLWHINMKMAQCYNLLYSFTGTMRAVIHQRTRHLTACW